jgi:predicted flap endonuclease-1-like 5' DNA nuclease
MSNRLRGQRGGVRWWTWVLIIVGLPLALLLWWWLRRRTEEEIAPAVRIEITPPPQDFAVPAPIVEPAPAVPDDLKRIEGIGPKISGLLQASGITTFAQLAASDASQIRAILNEAGITIADPNTWPEQAGLAAAGKWEALKALQARLKGGRRA